MRCVLKMPMDDRSWATWTKALKALRAPKHVIDLHLHAKALEPAFVTVTYYPETADGRLEPDENAANAFKILSEDFVLVRRDLFDELSAEFKGRCKT
jgi:hypothetical protein